jgi:hypothetical protein
MALLKEQVKANMHSRKQFLRKKLIITEKLGKKRSYLKSRESTTGR